MTHDVTATNPLLIEAQQLADDAAAELPEASPQQRTAQAVGLIAQYLARQECRESQTSETTNGGGGRAS